MAEKKSNTLSIVIRLLLGIAVLGLLLFVLHNLPVTLSDLWSEAINTLYTTGVNAIGLASLSRAPILFYFDIIILAITIIASLWREFSSAPPTRPLTTELIIIFIVVLSLQTASQATSFHEELTLFGGKTSEEKNILLLGPNYEKFLENCKKYLPGKHNAEFLTYVGDTKKGGILPITLGYDLYPIDIRNTRPGPKDCLIIFANKDYHWKLPEGFQILTQAQMDFKGTTYILLAAKKTIPPK